MVDTTLSAFLLPYPNSQGRRVRVYVPAHEEGELLPVIYMLDGQNLFYEDESPWGCWHILETVEEAREEGLGGVIIVAIDNGGINRDNELTPASIGEVVCPNEMDNYTESRGEEFDRFVVKFVMPYVEARFPVRKDRASTAICGSSSGGLQSFFTGLEHRDRFGMIGAFSPAFLLYSIQSWQNWLARKMDGELPYLYIYSGNGDQLEQKIYFSTELVSNVLMNLEYPDDLITEDVVFDNCHNEEAWEETFADFLEEFLSLDDR